jgi:predicted enzyme related to lactoylglutathione lyase
LQAGCNFRPALESVEDEGFFCGRACPGGPATPTREEASMLQRYPLYAYIPVKDLNRARQFYEEKIGLKPKEERQGGILYEFGEHTRCFMYPTPNAGSAKASQAFWQVDDIEREVAELKRRGVKFEEYDTPELKTRDGIATPGATKAAWFKDTEGNIMALIEPH